MNRKFRNYLTAAAMVGAVATVGAMMPAPAKADKPATDVNIASPLPLPVSGTVQAQQSGTWNVNLAGTPTVQLSPSGTSLPVRNQDERGRNPFQQRITGYSAGPGKTYQFDPVPPGRRLVLTHFSGGYSYVNFGGTAGHMDIRNPSQNGASQTMIPTGSNNGRIFIANEDILLYFEPGEVPTLAFQDTIDLSGYDVTVSGYYVNLP